VFIISCFSQTVKSFFAQIVSQPLPAFPLDCVREGGRAVKKNETTIGAKVRQLRKQAGLTLEALGDIADVHYSYIGMVERGRRQPSLKFLTKIADALGVPVAVLMGDTRREIRVDAADLLRRELLTLTQGLSAEELQKIVKVVKVVRTILQD
jgi:transcriptional regulator with XRE-family HTH domain